MMSQNRQTRERIKQKKLDRRRRKNKAMRNSASAIKQLTPKLSDKVGDVYELIRGGEFSEAEEMLGRLVKRYAEYPGVIEAQVVLYQTNKDHERCSQAAKQLAKLTPRDPEALMIYAQESMYCGRIGIALTNYQEFLKSWPDHKNAQKARNAIELVEPECKANIDGMGFGDGGLKLLVMHEEVLECIQNNLIQEAASKCLELIKLAPGFMSARNNLSIAYFHCGEIEKAVHVSEETCRLAPDNYFAQATLGRLYFLNGQIDQANAIADRLVGIPPTEQDPLVATVELLSFLGRDENVVALSSEAMEGHRIVNFSCKAVLLHHLAVAQCRLGDEKAARTSWKKCLKVMPSHPDARENLDDLNNGEGHAPWPESLGKWIPRSVIDNMLDGNGENSIRRTGRVDLVKNSPALAALIPALLDRGDPTGRELAMKLAAADGSPDMLNALKQFALSARGPDALRHEALSTVGRLGKIDSGPHHFYSCGKWIEIKLFMAEINWEPTKCSSPWVQKLVDTGTKAVNVGNYTLAEKSFSQILEKEPDNCCAAYNLAIVWLNRDGKSGQRRARARIEEIHRNFPDYRFASISLAQFAAMDGDLDRAKDLLEPIQNAKKLHASEATALFIAQVQIFIQRREFESAEYVLSLLTQIADEGDPHVAKLRRRLDLATGKLGLSRLFS